MPTWKPPNEHVMKVPPPYEPKLTVRVTDNRTKMVSEFAVDIPLEGYIKDMFPILKKVRKVLELHGLMPAPERPAAPEQQGATAS